MRNVREDEQHVRSQNESDSKPHSQNPTLWNVCGVHYVLCLILPQSCCWGAGPFLSLCYALLFSCSQRLSSPLALTGTHFVPSLTLIFYFWVFTLCRNSSVLVNKSKIGRLEITTTVEPLPRCLACTITQFSPQHYQINKNEMKGAGKRTRRLKLLVAFLEVPATTWWLTAAI